MQLYENGKTVKCIGNLYNGDSRATIGNIYTIKKLHSSSYYHNGYTGPIYELINKEGRDGQYAFEKDLQLITNNIYNNMNPLQKFALSLKKEPQKSFIKTGITDNDNMLTADGTKIFLSWLLETKYATEFKAEVVDALLAEEEKKA